MGTKAQALAVLHHYTALLGNGISAKELVHIQKGLGVAHHLHLRVECRQLCNVGTVVRLHVGDYQIIRLTACQSFGQVFQPRLGSAGIHRIQNGGLFVQNDIGIIAHAGGNRSMVVSSTPTPKMASLIFFMLIAFRLLFMICRRTQQLFLRIFPIIAHC